MKVKDLRKKLEAELLSFVDEFEAKGIQRIIWEDILDISQTKMLFEPDLDLDEDKVTLALSAIERLKKDEPVQHIVGSAHFYGNIFKVNNHTLIPRPETEELVELIILNSNGSESILDIGTGTGCIAISLKKNIPCASVEAMDVSVDALKVARGNATSNQAEVKFHEYNILEYEDWEGEKQFDIIVSNPPYICNKEKPLMKANVLEFEPHLALFVEDNDPLLFYRTITKFAKQNLSNSGNIYFEINEAYGLETVEMMQEEGFAGAQIIKDINGKDRIVWWQKNK